MWPIHIKSFYIEGDKITNINIFKRKLSIEEMIAITNGDRCGMEGDYLAWSNMKIKTTGVYYGYVPSTVFVTNISENITQLMQIMVKILHE